MATIIGEPRNSGRTYDWPRIEQSLGLRLPSDYKRLFEVYGAIGINGIMIGHPEELQQRHEEQDRVNGQIPLIGLPGGAGQPAAPDRRRNPTGAGRGGGHF